MREIRMLRAMRRGLETGLRWLLHGHEGGNPGYSQGAAYGLPRQFPTLPRWPARAMSAFPGPEHAKASAVPRKDGFRLDDVNGRAPAAP